MLGARFHRFNRVIVRLADRLTNLLRKGDPIAGRVALTKLDFMNCGLRGMASVWMGGGK